MKRFLFLTIACLFSIWGMAQIAADTYVEVLYFHGKQRCETLFIPYHCLFVFYLGNGSDCRRYLCGSSLFSWETTLCNLQSH